MTPQILPVKQIGDCKTGTINGLTVAQIEQKLGFKSNCYDDPYKVKNSWGFTVDGTRCAVWDYKGSEKFLKFSTFGPIDALKKVFGDNVA